MLRLVIKHRARVRIKYCDKFNCETPSPDNYLLLLWLFKFSSWLVIWTFHNYQGEISYRFDLDRSFHFHYKQIQEFPFLLKK